MISAKEARETALQVNEDNKNEQLSEIDQLIRQSVHGGVFVLRYNKELRQDVREILQAEGFILNDIDQRQGECSTIIKY